MSTTLAVPAEQDTARIAAVEDVIVRNLLITQCYHELAVALQRRTGTGANWCAFATWASKQAGRTIRREDLRDALRLRLRESSELAGPMEAVVGALRDVRPVRDAASLADIVLRALESAAAFDRASAAVAEGNLKVFAEIGREFARFVAIIGEQGDGGAAYDAFRAALRQGPPPDGQQLLRDAFDACRASLTAPDPAARAQHLFHANLLVGLHEQTRLQPQIASALNAAFDTGAVRAGLLNELLPGPWLRIRHRVAALFGRRPPLDVAIDRLLAGVQRELRRIITANAMTLRFPGGRVIRLGRDVDGQFPPELTTISNTALAALLHRVDLTPDTVVGSGATDWADLDQRMHLITDLFRCSHALPILFEPPFSAGQTAALRSGRVPAGPL